MRANINKTPWLHLIMGYVKKHAYANIHDALMLHISTKWAVNCHAYLLNSHTILDNDFI